MTSHCEKCDCEMHPSDASISELCRRCERSCRTNKGRYLTQYGRSVIRAWDRHADAARSASLRHSSDPDDDNFETDLIPDFKPTTAVPEYDNLDSQSYVEDYGIDRDDMEGGWEDQ